MDLQFPFENETHLGKEFIVMKSDVFHSFFLALMTYANNEPLTNEISQLYTKAKQQKRKRIRLKKEKQALLFMYETVMHYFYTPK